MHELLFDPRVLFLASLHCFVGIIAALVARRKGYHFRNWLLWGLIGGTPTLIVALWRSPYNSPQNNENEAI